MVIRVRLGPAPNKQVAFSLLSPPCLVLVAIICCRLSRHCLFCCLDFKLSLASSTTPSRTCTTATSPTRFLDAAETCTAAANSASTSPRPKSFQSCPALAATGATALQHHLTRPPTRFVCRRLVSTADESDEGDTPAATSCARWDAVGATPSTPAPILLSLFFMETVIHDHTPLADYLKGWFP